MIYDITYWAWFGTLTLLILTYKDFKNNMLVDDRKNFFMMGASAALLSHFFRPLWYIALLIVLGFAFQYYIKKIKALGAADAHALAWIFYGFGLFGPYLLIGFLFAFAACTIFYYLLKLYIFKYTHKTPFFPVILISYVLSSASMGLYI